jgi:hypothetical protein
MKQFFNFHRFQDDYQTDSRCAKCCQCYYPELNISRTIYAPRWQHSRSDCGRLIERQESAHRPSHRLRQDAFTDSRDQVQEYGFQIDSSDDVDTTTQRNKQSPRHLLRHIHCLAKKNVRVCHLVCVRCTPHHHHQTSSYKYGRYPSCADNDYETLLQCKMLVVRMTRCLA